MSNKEDELFHIVHSAIWYINEKRSYKDKIQVLDREIGEAIKELAPFTEIFEGD